MEQQVYPSFKKVLVPSAVLIILQSVSQTIHKWRQWLHLNLGLLVWMVTFYFCSCKIWQWFLYMFPMSPGFIIVFQRASTTQLCFSVLSSTEIQGTTPSRDTRPWAVHTCKTNKRLLQVYYLWRDACRWYLQHYSQKQWSEKLLVYDLHITGKRDQ